MIRSRSLALAAVTATVGLTLLTGCRIGSTAKTAGSTLPVPTTQTAAPGTDGSTSPVPAGPVKTAYPRTPAPALTPGAGKTPVPPVPGIPAKRFATPNEAAVYLVDAWRRGDRKAALQAAGPNTVAKVFAVRYVVTPIDECTPQSGNGHAFLCYHRYEGGSTGFDVDPYAPSGYRVVNFTRTAD